MTKPEEHGKRALGLISHRAEIRTCRRARQGDESVPAYNDGGKPDFETAFTNGRHERSSPRYLR